MSWTEILTNALGAVGGVGGLALAIKFLIEKWQERESRQDARERVDAQNLDAGFVRLEAAAKRLDNEVARLGEKVDRQEEEILSLQQSNALLAEENRTFRTVITGIIERLRRHPPDSAEAILTFILEHLPSFGRGNKE